MTTAVADAPAVETEGVSQTEDTTQSAAEAAAAVASLAGDKAAEDAALAFMIENKMVPGPQGEAVEEQPSGPGAVNVPGKPAPQAGAAPEVTPPAETRIPATTPDASLVRHAQLHGVDLAEFGDDVAGLRRTLSILDRKAAETSLGRQPEATRPAAPAPEAKPLLADKLKATGIYDDTLIDAMRELELSNREMRQELSQTKEQTAAQREDAHYSAIDEAIQSLDPEVFGTGKYVAVSPAMQQERARVAGLVNRLIEDCQENGEPIPPYSDLVQSAYAARHPGRLKAKTEQTVAATVTETLNKRKGTPTGRPSHEKPPVLPRGDEAAEQAARNFMVENNMLDPRTGLPK